MVWDLFGDDARGQLFRERFLPRLRVFHHQVHVTDLDDLILQEILKILGKPLPQLVANQVLLYFLQEIKSWADKNNGECIWRHSRLLELAVGSELRRQAMATTGRLKFIDEHCSSLLRKLKQTLRGLPPRSLQVSVQGVPAGLRASKLLQVLDGSDEFRYKWVYFNDTVLQTFSIAFLITVCNTCQVIVLDTDISSNRLIFQEEMSQVRHEKCVVTLKSLENGEFTDNWTLNELDEENQVLHLNRAINFQGKRIPLKDLESSWESMRQDIDGEFLAILEKQEPKMGGDILPLKEHVLPRRLAHRHVVSAKTLVEKEAVGGDERLALEGFPQSLLEQVARHLGFLDDERDEKLSSVLLKNNDRWTVMNYEDEPSRKDVNQFLESLAREKKAPAIHCLVYVSGRSLEEVCMIWRNSFGTTDVIQNRIIPLTRDCNVKEPLCIHRSTTSLRSLKRALLVGAAGHGKTTYFSSLASELKEEDPTHWVVKLKILQHTNLLRKWRNVKELTVDHVIEVLATAAGAETGSTRRFLEAALRHSGAVSILVDGVDEIAPFFKEVTLRLLHLIMNETRVRRLWISTRPEVEQSLRRLLKSPPLALQSLTEEEQGQILSTLLTSSISGSKEIRAKEIVHLVNKKVDELLATPLHLKMLAEVLSSKDNQSLDVRKLTLLNLYNNFVSIKLREFEERYNAENLTHDDVDEKHEKCSIVYLFADDPFAGELPVEEFKEFIMKNNSLLKATEKYGIVWLNEKKTISFVHQTFAEFFAAKWFWKNARESAGARTYVLQMNEWSDKNRFQSFLNDMLAEDWPFHAAAWRKDMREVERLVENGLGVENWDMRDALLDWTFGQYVEWAYQEHIDVYFPKRNSLDAWLIIALKAAVVSGCAKIVSKIASRVVRSSAILNRLLHEAAKCQGNAQVDVTRILLQHGAKDSVGPSGWSALHWSVENRNSAMMELLLSMSHDQDVNQRNYLGQTPLHLALRGWTFNHWHEGAQRLIQKKTIDVNVKDRVGESPLMYACFSNCVSCVGALLNRKAHIDGQTLAKVTRNGSDNALRSILENEAHLDPLHEDVSTALHLAAFYGHKDILQLLLCHGAKVNASDSKGETALHIGTLSTALEGSTELLQLLLSYGANVNTTDSQGCTVLHYAAKEGHKVAVELFLSRGGLVNATDSCGQTPLHVAASHKHKEVVQSLLSRGAKFDVTNVDGCTALHIAASHGDNEIVRLLLDECGDPGVEFSSVYSAMEVAMNRNEWETAKIVLEHIPTDVTVRCLIQAAEANNVDVLKFLLNEGIDSNATDEESNTPLHAAAKKGHTELVELLLEKGGEKSVKNKEGKTPLQLAMQNLHFKCAKILW